MAADRDWLIRIIHVARRELAMDDDTYRGILQRVGNAQSAKDLSVSSLQRVLEHMKACGFKVRPARKQSRPLAEDPESKKIRAVWLFMHELGIVRDPSEKALAVYVKRIARVDALQWTNGDQTLVVIESLKSWSMRFLPHLVRNLAVTVMALPMIEIERLELQERLNEAFARGTYDPMLVAWNRLQDLQRKYRGERHE